MATVTILRGTTRGKQVRNQTFPLIKGFSVGDTSGKGFVTVDGTKLYGLPKARIRVKSEKDFVIEGKLAEPVTKQPIERKIAAADKNFAALSAIEDDSIPDVESTETDKQIVDRINKRFDMLNKLTLGVRRGDITSMFVTGAPGVGKTFGVEKTLAEAGMIEQFANEAKRYQIISGYMTSIALYMKFFEFNDSNSVLVFDDCDMVLTEEVSLNLLKAALDTSEKRHIHWGGDSKLLRKTGVPDNFEFKGSVIFISNINFAKIRGYRMRAHLGALMSRSLFLDLTIHTHREKMLRIEDCVKNGMIEKFNLSKKTGEDIMKFVREHAKDFNMLSLREVIKLARLAKTFDESSEWKEAAMMTLTGSPMSY